MIARASALCLGLLFVAALGGGASACSNPDALGVGRVVEIDTSRGRLYGSITTFPSYEVLRDKEVILTFDDGPYPGLTQEVLNALDRECTLATFFVVGQMVANMPGMVKAITARGHTVGTHTMTHPLGVRRLPFEAVRQEIDQGFAAANRAAPGMIAPFFRFPGLGDNTDTLAYLQSKGISTFTVDIISNDSFIRDPEKMVKRTMNILAQRGKGIILMHDIKASTARGLPLLLSELKRNGYKVVHLRPRAPFTPGKTPVPMIAKKSTPPEAELVTVPRSTLSAAPRQTPIAVVPAPLPPAQQPVPQPVPAVKPSEWRTTIFEKQG
jgi:peptidoglycan/xylan/chitin deacetylase (PgdA/CDA1 family)